MVAESFPYLYFNVLVLRNVEMEKRENDDRKHADKKSDKIIKN